MALEHHPDHVPVPERSLEYEHFEIRTLTPHIGAEIRGIDLSQPLTPSAEKEVRRAFHDWMVLVFPDQDLTTGQLNDLLEKAVSAHQPPLVRGRRAKLRYAHLGGNNPPKIIIHGNSVDALPESYRRYLMNYFRDSLGLVGTTIRVEFRRGDNPFAGKRNELTPRQIAKRQRLRKHSKRKA